MGSSTYPVAYRKSATGPVSPGFQGQPGVPYNPNVYPTGPNVRPVFFPANDNVPARMPKPKPKGFSPYLRWFGRVSWVATGYFAWEDFQFIKREIGDAIEDAKGETFPWSVAMEGLQPASQWSAVDFCTDGDFRGFTSHAPEPFGNPWCPTMVTDFGGMPTTASKNWNYATAWAADTYIPPYNRKKKIQCFENLLYGDPAAEDGTWSETAGAALNQPIAAYIPSVNPMATPIKQPAPNPEAVPYREIPGRVPNPELVNQYETGPRPVTPPFYAPPPALAFSPGAVPGAVPPAGRRPPRRGEKEKKLRFGHTAVWRIFSFAMNLFTESQDFIRAIWKALPDEYRAAGRYDTVTQLEQIFEHFDQIVWTEAVWNVIANQIEDWIIGKMNRNATLGAEELGIYWQYRSFMSQMRFSPRSREFIDAVQSGELDEYIGKQGDG